MHRRGFSLASILLLTAVVAVLLAAMCTAWLGPDKVKGERVAVCTAIGTFVGLCVGVVVGARQTRWLLGILVGAATGVLAGAAGGALLAVPGKMPSLLIGSVVLVLFGVVVRRYSGGPPHR